MTWVALAVAHLFDCIQNVHGKDRRTQDKDKEMATGNDLGILNGHLHERIFGT